MAALSELALAIQLQFKDPWTSTGYVEDFLNIHPGNPYATVIAATDYEQLGRYKDAVSVLETGVRNATGSVKDYIVIILHEARCLQRKMGDEPTKMPPFKVHPLVRIQKN